MTPVRYFLHLKTLDILLLIVNISVANDAFINTIFFVVILRLHFTWKNVNFQQFFVVVKMTERRKNQSEEWTYFTQLFMYFKTVNKHWFCISVIGYINVQIIGIGCKKSISVNHYSWPRRTQKANWNNVLWSDVTKLGLFGLVDQRLISIFCLVQKGQSIWEEHHIHGQTWK